MRIYLYRTGIREQELTDNEQQEVEFLIPFVYLIDDYMCIVV